MTHEEMISKVAELDRLAMERKAIEEQEEAIRNSLKADLEAKGTESVELENGRKISWKEVFSNSFNSKKFKADMPDIYNQYLRIGVIRRFQIA